MAVPLEPEFERLLGLRARIEMFAARQAAQAAGEGASTGPLASACRDVEQAIRHEDRDGLGRADEHLHGAIIELAATPALEQVWCIVWNELRAFHRESLHKYWPDLRSLSREHRHLVDAICSGDPGAAEDAARSHLEAVFYRTVEGTGPMAAGEDPVQRVVAYTAFNLHRLLKLSDVAAEVAFVCPGHLSRLFRERFGVGFQKYVQRARLDRAATLLRTSRLPVREIAARTGYRDGSRFAQHFRRRFHCTPRQYRRR